jgi:mannose-6-phosphate isomerase-like protein (cupin superfamily)
MDAKSKKRFTALEWRAYSGANPARQPPIPALFEEAELLSLYSENRPWGAFYVLDEKPGFKVKRIVVKEGGRLSLQSHKHRYEHWTVVEGTATVTVDDKVVAMTRGQAVDIPLHAKHRLENLHPGEMTIIEVQFGDYLGEDDIIRYDDAYARS